MNFSTFDVIIRKVYYSRKHINDLVTAWNIFNKAFFPHLRLKIWTFPLPHARSMFMVYNFRRKTSFELSLFIFKINKLNLTQYSQLLSSGIWRVYTKFRNVLRLGLVIRICYAFIPDEVKCFSLNFLIFHFPNKVLLKQDGVFSLSSFL